jgi:hypothetical protein
MLAAQGGLAWVGAYVSVAAAVSLVAVIAMRETRDIGLGGPGPPPGAAPTASGPNDPACPSHVTWHAAFQR